MDWLGSRFYLPVLGRFLTQDPIGHGGGLNLYAYCDDNPLTRFDPSGHDWDVGEYLSGVAGVFKGYWNTLSGVVTSPYHLYRYYQANGVSWNSTKNLGIGAWQNFASGITGDRGAEGFGESFMSLELMAAPGLKAIPLSFTAAGRAAAIAGRAGAAAGFVGLGSATWEEAMAAGRQFLGRGFRASSKGDAWLSADGLRQFRAPSYKPKLGKMQANFESRSVPRGDWTRNGHLDIRP